MSSSTFYTSSRPQEGASCCRHLPLRRHRRGPSPAATRTWQLPASTSSTPTPTTPAPTAAPSTRSTMPAAGQRLLHHRRCRSNTNARTEQQHLLHQQPPSGGSLLLPTSTSTSPSRTVSRCHPHLAAPSVNIIDADANYTGANRSTVNQIDDAGRWAAIATSPPLPQQHKRED